VVDLRTTEETLRWPCSLAGDARFDYRHLNLEGDEPIPWYDLSQEHWPLSDSYAALLANRGQAVREILATFASSPETPTVFFCAGGTDRTGIIAALVLGLAGVPDDVIAEDYSLSAKGLVRRFTAEGAPSWMSPDHLASGRALATLARPTIMMELLRLVRRDYGGVNSYLLHAGVTAEEIELLRDSLAG
jgi:protein-tyrosine phosphatase